MKEVRTMLTGTTDHDDEDKTLTEPLSLHSHCLAPPLACLEGVSPPILPALPITQSLLRQVTCVRITYRRRSSGCMSATWWPNKLSEPAAASVHKCCKMHDWRWRTENQELTEWQVTYQSNLVLVHRKRFLCGCLRDWNGQDVTLDQSQRS